jgi:hypothetical protein
MIRYNATSCSIDRYVTTAFFDLPSAFLTARDLSSSLDRLKDLAGAVDGVVGERGDDNSSIRPCNSCGDAQKRLLPQLLKVDAVDATVGVTGVRRIRGSLEPTTLWVESVPK